MKKNHHIKVQKIIEDAFKAARLTNKQKAIIISHLEKDFINGKLDNTIYIIQFERKGYSTELKRKQRWYDPLKYGD